jgi:NAD(P)-dependent dehydrogenase (short-subunit alcohol dehydrogenase family)
MNNQLAGKLVLITGASRGIGRAAALAFARAGAHVVALARKVEDLEALDDEIKRMRGEATLVPADLRDFDALDRLGAALNEHWRKLDVLVLNAGVLGPVMPIAQVPPKAWAEILDVNVTANYRLLRSMDPLLRRAEAGRVIAVTSGAARKARAYLGGYSITKAALDMLIKTYAEECANTAIKANLVNPGPMRTAMRATLMPGEDPMSLPAPEEICPLLLELAAPSLARSGETIEFRDWREGRVKALETGKAVE